MQRYLKMISWTILTTGLIIITIIVVNLILWQNQQKNKPINKTMAIPVAPQINNPILNGSSITGSIEKIATDTIWIKRWGREYEIKINTETTIIKTDKPIPLVPGGKNQIKTKLNQTVSTNYLKTGQEVKILPKVISSSKPILIAVKMEIWD